MSVFEKLPVHQRIAIMVSEAKLEVHISSGVRAKANCPFHSEKVPSFQINRHTGQWHCFGCGRGGDFIDFVSEITGISITTAFPELLKYIDEKYGTSLCENRQNSNTESALFEIYEYAANWYHQTLFNLSRSHPAWKYLESRKISEFTIRNYRIGFGGDRSDYLLSHLTKCSHLAQDDLSCSALFYAPKDGRKPSDVFSGRILFPITSAGRVVSFSGRSINTQNPKYLNGSQTAIFSKSSCLFGFGQAKDAIREHGYSIVVEGYFDVLSMVQAGYQNTVGLMGTSAGAKQMRLLSGAANRALLFLDLDDAGYQATISRVLPIAITANLKCTVMNPLDLNVGSGKLDPDALCNRLSPQAIQSVIRTSSQTPEEFVFGQIRRTCNIENSQTDHFKNRCIWQFASIFRNCGNPCRQQEAANWLSQKIGVDSQLILKFFADDSAYASLQQLLTQAQTLQRSA